MITIYRAVGVTETKIGWNQASTIFGVLGGMGMGSDLPLELNGAWQIDREAAEKDARELLDAHGNVWAVRIEEGLTTEESYATYVEDVKAQVARIKAEAEEHTAREVERATANEDSFRKYFGG